MTAIEVYCDKHSRTWKIADFLRDNDGSWHERTAITKKGRVRQKDLAAKVEAEPPQSPEPGSTQPTTDFLGTKAPGDTRSPHRTALDSDQPVPASTEGWRRQRPGGDAALRSTYDLTCPRCKRERRHASYQRREEALFAIFDELAAIAVTRVTPEFLHQHEARRGTNPS